MVAAKTLPTVSVAVLNHRRAHLLGRVLTAVSQLDYPAFEIVVVGDQPTLAAYDLPNALSAGIKYVHFAEPNICRARNTAIRLAAGEIVAFIDDDAVPEPDWLSQLVRPFTDPKVAVVGGTVRASDGVTLEWQGGLFDRTGTEAPFELTADVTVLDAAEQRASGRYLSLRGVNSAFRRSALLEVGGFDEAIRYYLDETDMALRLADAGWSCATVRNAEVHHLLVPNATRGLLRKPGNQHEIGAAKAVFCGKHSPAQCSAELAAFHDRRVAMLDPQMRLGIVRSIDRDRVSAQLRSGFRDGETRASIQPLSMGEKTSIFQPFVGQAPTRRRNFAIETGWNPETISELTKLARWLSDKGHRVTRLTFRSGWDQASVSFRDGIWIHRGGTWALPKRSDGPLAIGRAARARAERRRVDVRRKFDAVLSARAISDKAEFIELPGFRRRISLHVAEATKADGVEIRAMLQCVAAEHDPAQNGNDDSIGALGRSEAVSHEV